MLPWINLYFRLRTIPVKPVTIVLTLLMMFVGGAAEAETVKTTDGRTIILKKDGTYKILKDVPKIEYQSVDINSHSIYVLQLNRHPGPRAGIQKATIDRVRIKTGSRFKFRYVLWDC